LNFILATGYATKDMAIDALRASAVDILEKPILAADLEQVLHRISALHETPTIQDMLLDKMSSLSMELQRLSQLMGQGAQSTAIPPHDKAAVRGGPCAPEPNHHNEHKLAPFIRELLKTESKRREIGGGGL